MAGRAVDHFIHLIRKSGEGEQAEIINLILKYKGRNGLQRINQKGLPNRIKITPSTQRAGGNSAGGNAKIITFTGAGVNQ